MSLDLTKFITFIVFLTIFLIKIYLIILLINRGTKNPEILKKFLLLCGALSCAAFSDFTWVLRSVRILFFLE